MFVFLAQFSACMDFLSKDYTKKTMSSAWTFGLGPVDPIKSFQQNTDELFKCKKKVYHQQNINHFIDLICFFVLQNQILLADANHNRLRFSWPCW